jgi:hypothetical protein
VRVTVVDICKNALNNLKRYQHAHSCRSYATAKLFVGTLLSGAALFAVSPTHAVVNLTLTTSGSAIGQNNLDCVFSATTCPNGSLGLTEPSPYGSSSNTYTGTSLTYYLQSGGNAGNTLLFNKFEILSFFAAIRPERFRRNQAANAE